MENTDTNSSQPSTLKRLLFSPDESRLRAGWRLLLQTLLLLLIGLLVYLPLRLVFQRVPAPSSPILAIILNSSITLISITASVFIARRLIDRRTITSLGLKVNMHALEDILAGFLIPALMVALIFFLERIFGWIEVVGFAWGASPLETVLPTVLIGLLTFIIVGWQEELLSRGYYLQNLEEGLNLPWAALLSPLVFGALHLANASREQTIMAIVGILLTSVFYAYAYVRTRQLWLPIGLHVGLSFFEGPIYGFPVGGLTADSLVMQFATGPEIITGGAYGPEAGLILIPALVLGFGLVYYFTHGREIERVDGRISSPDGEKDQSNLDESFETPNDPEQ